MNARYAIYWAPSQDSALWRTGCHILGRDAATGEELPQPGLPGLTASRFQELTASPRLYGLHATLKAPFRLAAGASETELRYALQGFASKQYPFPLPRLALTSIGHFLALTPLATSVELGLMSRDCVEAFDYFRAPPTATELEKRLSCGLTSHQSALLNRWGYPYVMEEYRFHLTLTGSIVASQERQMCQQGLSALLAGGVQNELARVEVREICLFEQPEQGHPFRIMARYPFGAVR